MNPRHLPLDTSNLGAGFVIMVRVVSLNDNSIADVPDSDPPDSLGLWLFGLRSPSFIIANESGSEQAP